jgi:hypothetical protein
MGPEEGKYHSLDQKVQDFAHKDASLVAKCLDSLGQRLE